MAEESSHDRPASDLEESHHTLVLLEEALEIQRRVTFVAGLFGAEVNLTTLLASYNVSLLVINPESRLVLVNQRLEKLFGYNYTELLGQPLHLLLSERSFQEHGPDMARYFEAAQVWSLEPHLELVGRRKDGAEFPIEMSLNYLDAPAGRLTLIFVTDITERKQLENDLQTQNAILKSFAQTVAHDLQSSLSTVLGISEYLLIADEELGRPELRAELRTLARASRKMSKIISELLLLADLRKNEVPLEVVEMIAVIRAALERLSESAAQPGAIIRYSDDYPPVLGYGPWLEEVWYNYLSNALKYGGQPPQIEIGSSPQADGQVRFWVKDNGPGIAAEQQFQLFSPYIRLNTVRAVGHGLGLALVKQIIERLNGQVYIESTLGQGSVFGFSLPHA